MDYSKYVQGQGHQAHMIACAAWSLKLISYGPIGSTARDLNEFDTSICRSYEPKRYF